MTFQIPTWEVDGNLWTGQLARMMFEACTEQQGGVVSPLDCIVRATGPASAGVTIDDGSVVVTGAEASAQGSYFGYNDGLSNELLGQIAPAGGVARSDLIVARAEDPTFPGSSWGNSANGQIVFPRVVSGVPAGTRTAPVGMSAEPLARIDMPIGATTVAAGYIVDLRRVAQPRQDRKVQSAQGAWGGAPSSSPTGATGIWPNPNAYTTLVPPWATWVDVVLSLTGVQFQPGTGGNPDAQGSVQLIFLLTGSITIPDVAGPSAVFHCYASTEATGSRRSLVAGGGFAIPASLRGQTVTIETVVIPNIASGATGVLVADDATASVVDLTFRQLAALA